MNTSRSVGFWFIHPEMLPHFAGHPLFQFFHRLRRSSLPTEGAQGWLEPLKCYFFFGLSLPGFFWSFGRQCDLGRHSTRDCSAFNRHTHTKFFLKKIKKNYTVQEGRPCAALSEQAWCTHRPFLIFLDARLPRVFRMPVDYWSTLQEAHLSVTCWVEISWWTDKLSNIAATFELSDYLKTKPSPSLLKREAEKNHKYSRLITVAQKQTKDKKRLHCPSFNSFIVSDYGDVSPAAIELQEWLLQPMQRSVSVKEQELMDAILQTWFAPSVKDSSLMFNLLSFLVLVECCSRLGSRSGTMCSNWFMCVRAYVYLANVLPAKLTAQRRACSFNKLDPREKKPTNQQTNQPTKPNKPNKKQWTKNPTPTRSLTLPWKKGVVSVRVFECSTTVQLFLGGVFVEHPNTREKPGVRECSTFGVGVRRTLNSSGVRAHH